MTVPTDNVVKFNIWKSIVRKMKHLTLSGILIIYLTILFLSGCSKVERHEQILIQMQREMKALQKNNLNADRRNEELKNTLSILDSKVERNNQAITELRDAVLSKGIPEIQCLKKS